MLDTYDISCIATAFPADATNICVLFLFYSNFQRQNIGACPKLGTSIPVAFFISSMGYVPKILKEGRKKNEICCS